MTPHASFLALRYAPQKALANLRALCKEFSIFDAQGFHDSENVTTGEVSNCVLSLDQGMILAYIEAVGIGNQPKDSPLFRAGTNVTKTLGARRPSSRTSCSSGQKSTPSGG